MRFYWYSKVILVCFSPIVCCLVVLFLFVYCVSSCLETLCCILFPSVLCELRWFLSVFCSVFAIYDGFWSCFVDSVSCLVL